MANPFGQIASGHVTRFAPSPNGALHIGHAYAAIVAHDLAKGAAGDLGGRFLLRIEDIDGARSREDLADEMREDLAWLGLCWEDVPAQSTRIDRYHEAAARLRDLGLLYPCICTRAQISAAATNAGPEGPIYPGTCKHGLLGGAALEGAAWRLDVDAAMAICGPLEWRDDERGVQRAQPELLGDAVLVRKDADTPASYHLAATLDDGADGVSLVTRGQDLFTASHIHRLLQALLSLPKPVWHHHGLIVDAGGQKLAKRRGSASLADWRGQGMDGRQLAADLRAGVLPSGLSLSAGVG